MAEQQNSNHDTLDRESLNERGLSLQYREDALEKLFDDSMESDGHFLYERKHQDDDGTLNGGYYYDKAVMSPSYKSRATDSTKQLFDDNYEQLSKYFEPKDVEAIIELGPGGIGKIFDLLEQYSISGKKYIPVDLAQYFINKAQEFAKKNRMRAGYGVTSNYYDRQMYEDLEGTIVQVGGSIGNVDEKQNMNWIGNVGPNRKMVIEFFPAPAGKDKQDQIESIKEMYRTPEMKERVMNGFRALGLDTNELQYTVDYKEGSPAMVKFGAQLKSAITVKVGGKLITKQKGDYLWAISSRRYTKEEFTSLAEGGGASIDTVVENGKTALALMHTPAVPLLKKVRTKRQDLDRKRKNSLYGVLCLGLGAVSANEINTYIQNKEHEKQIEIQIDDALTSREPRTFVMNDGISLEKKKGYFESALKDIIHELEVRYGNEISQDKLGTILGNYVDWVDNGNFKPEKVNMVGHMGEYDVHYYNPTDVERFVMANKNSLLQGGLDLLPNKGLIQYQEALRNTLLYQGEQKTFNSVDKQLGTYVGNVVSRSHPGMIPDSRSGKAGIKYIDEKPYFLISMHAKEDVYILAPFQENHYGISLGCQKQVADIIKRGQVTLIAEQIRQFINNKYGTASGYVVNGQEQIVYYLTKLYADGFDLSYLLGPEYEEYSNLRQKMDAFVKSYVIPAIGEKLQKGSSRMHDVLFEEIEKQREVDEYIDVQELTKKVVRYLEQYTCMPDPGFQRSTESAILKMILQQNIAKVLDSEWMIRCWITENRHALAELGFKVIAYYELSHAIVDHCGGRSQGADWVNKIQEYTLLDGSVLNIGKVSTHNFFNQDHDSFGMYVAQKGLSNVEMDNLINQNLRSLVQSKYGKSFDEMSIERRKQLEDRYKHNLIRNAFIDNNQRPYTGENMKKVIEDNQQWKEAWQIYNERKP